jgi:hypothetical protein
MIDFICGICMRESSLGDYDWNPGRAALLRAQRDGNKAMLSIAQYDCRASQVYQTPLLLVRVLEVVSTSSALTRSDLWLCSGYRYSKPLDQHTAESIDTSLPCSQAATVPL